MNDAQPSLNNRFVPPLMALFFVSGACGLIYEVVWMKTLTVVFGSTALAISTILASFMSGLALGSYLFGRCIERRKHPLRIYALLELGTGLFAFIMPFMLSSLDGFYVFIYQNVTTSYAGLSLIRLALSLLVLIIPAALMGGTLPVVTHFLTGLFGKPGSRIGQLYFINTMGAAAGTFAAGFILIAGLGINGSAYLAGGMNIVIAIVVLGMDKSISFATQTEPTSLAPAAVPPEDDAALSPRYSRTARIVLWALAVSGFCSLAYEVLWTRALVFILDNTAQAFTTMLMAFLLGIALGSIASARFADRIKHPLVMLGAAEALIAITALISIPVFTGLGAGLGGSPESIFSQSIGMWQWAGIRLGRALIVMLLPTFLMGTIFPLAGKVLAQSTKGAGSAVGKLYSLNTMGGVIGSFAAGFILIPWLGVYHSVMLVAGINAAVGLTLLLAEYTVKLSSRLKSASLGAVSFTAALAILFSMGQVVFTSPIELVIPSRTLYYNEGIGSTVKVFQDITGDKRITIDGFSVAGTAPRHQDAQRSLGNLPLLLSQVSCPRVNLVGFGAGGATWAATLYNPSAVDCVELVPSVIEAARLFPEVNHGVMDAPGVNIIAGDGRNYLLVTDKEYDVITVDATSPKSAGSGSLYTKEFYESCKTRLGEDGLVAQWLPYHLLSGDEIKMTIRTFQMVFPHSSLWFSLDGYYFILIGTQSELSLDFRLLQQKMADEKILEELAPVGIYDSYDVLSCFIMGEDDLRNYSAGAKVNTDDHPYLEYSASKSYFNADDLTRENLFAINPWCTSVLPYLFNTGDTGSEEADVQVMLEARSGVSQ